MRFSCPECGKLLTANDGDVGKRARCPHCSLEFHVPDSVLAEFASRESPSGVSGVPAMVKTLPLAASDGRRSSNLAIASLILGVFGGLMLVGWVLVLWTGVLSESDVPVVVGLGVLGGVTVAVWILTISFALVAAGRVRSNAGLEKGRLLAWVAVILTLIWVFSLFSAFYYRETGELPIVGWIQSEQPERDSSSAGAVLLDGTFLDGAGVQGEHHV